jgi:DnaK suppressor protein
MGVIREWPADRGEMRRLLGVRRRELTDVLHTRMERIREHGATTLRVADDDHDGANEIDAAIADLATATLHRIDQAIARLDRGDYGRCTHCGLPISDARLRAMPFAVRCRQCESARETDEVAARQSAAAGRLRLEHGEPVAFVHEES